MSEDPLGFLLELLVLSRFHRNGSQLRDREQKGEKTIAKDKEGNPYIDKQTHIITVTYLE